VKGCANNVVSGTSIYFLGNLMDGGFVVGLHALGTAIVEVENVQLGKVGVVKAGLVYNIFE